MLQGVRDTLIPLFPSKWNMRLEPFFGTLRSLVTDKVQHDCEILRLETFSGVIVIDYDRNACIACILIYRIKCMTGQDHVTINTME